MRAYNVKSAERVLELLEFFAEWRQGATVNEIAQSLNYPQSSTSILMKCLHETGYFDHEPRTGIYAPNVRLALATAWISEHLFSEGSLLKMMEKIREATGHTVMIGKQQGINVRYLHTLQSTRPTALRAKNGWLRPLFRSASGRMLLTTKTEREMSLLLRRANAMELDASSRVDEIDARRNRQQALQDGFAVSIGTASPGAGAVAVLLPIPRDNEPMALCVGGPVEEIERDQASLAALLQDIVFPLKAMVGEAIN